MQNRFFNIKKQWFYLEPLLYSVLASHSFIENNSLNVCLRCGKGRIEFNKSLCEKLSDEELEDFLKIEAFRILLGHPYSRKPENPKNGVLLLASDVIISSFYKPKTELKGITFLKNEANRFHILENPLGQKWKDSEELNFFKRNLNKDKNGNLVFADKLSFEQWYYRILFLIKETSSAGSEIAGDSQSNKDFLENGEETGLWEENQEKIDEINKLKKNCDLDGLFDGLSGGEIRAISESEDFSFDYRKALTQFRNNVVSASRKLTRMRPSRRYGFKAMGSRYDRKADILIAVDVSGSISDESFKNFNHAVKNFFFLGLIEKIDLIFFDVNLKNTKPYEFRKKIDFSNINGRGGTNFQVVFDFYSQNQKNYSGLIIFSDGEGNIPDTKNAKNVLWILNNRSSFEKNKKWISALNSNKVTYLPV